MTRVFFICILIALFFNNYMGAALGLSSIVLTSCAPLLLWCIAYLIKIGNKKIRKDLIFRRTLFIIGFTFLAIICKILISQPEFVREFIILTIIPSIFIITFKSLPTKNIHYLRVATICLFIFECTLSIIERVKQQIFFSNEDVYSIINKEEDLWSFRSSALFGHPIANSMVVTIMTAFILCSNIKNKSKLLLLVLSISAQMCFNTRGGIVLTVLIALPFIIELLKKSSFSAKFIISLFLVVICYSFYNAMNEFDLGGRMFNLSESGIFNDNSSSARLEAFSFYEYLSVEEILFGSSDLYERLLLLMNLSGIENGFIAIIVRFGIILGTILILSLILLHLSMLKNYYSKKQIFLIFMAFYGYGMTNPHLSNSTVWYIFIYSYFAFRPIKEKKLLYGKTQ